MIREIVADGAVFATYRGYLEVPIPELLLLELLERDGTCGSVLVITFVGHVRDKRADVFLELGQIGDDVVLSEDDTIVVVHLRSYREDELRRDEGLNHDLNRLLDFGKHFLRLRHLVVSIEHAQSEYSSVKYMVYLRLLNFGLIEVELILHLLTKAVLLLLRIVLELNHLVDLLANLAVRVL